MSYSIKIRHLTHQISMENGACCYLCNECANSFTSLEELEDHMNEHGNGTQDEIGNTYGEKDSTPIEMDIQRKQSQQQQQDEEDHSPSSSDTSLNFGGFDTFVHGVQLDADSGPQHSHQCRICSKLFSNRAHLNVHYTHTHKDKPRYECEQCRVVFAVKRELSTHQRLHSGEQPHICSQCGKQFGTRQLLKKHWMWHTGERSHVCPHCSKAFFQKGHLTQHLMIHAGGRPHQCSLCQKTFIFKFDLNRHMKIHAERGYCCGKCARAFLTQTELEEHSGKCRAVLRKFSTSRTNPTTPMSETKSEQSYSPLIPNNNNNNDTDNSITSISTPPLSTQQYFCFFCMRQFTSQAAYTLHLSFVHFRNGQLLNNGQNEEQPSFPIMPLVNNIASLPNSTNSESVLVPVPNCDDCESLRKKNGELQRTLWLKEAEMDKLKGTLSRIGSMAGTLLESCSDFDKLWMLHSKKVHTQIQSVLCTIE